MLPSARVGVWAGLLLYALGFQDLVRRSWEKDTYLLFYLIYLNRQV